MQQLINVNSNATLFVTFIFKGYHKFANFHGVNFAIDAMKMYAQVQTMYGKFQMYDLTLFSVSFIGMKITILYFKL